MTVRSERNKILKGILSTGPFFNDRRDEDSLGACVPGGRTEAAASAAPAAIHKSIKEQRLRSESLESET